jgi:hypothetical protein
MSKKLDRCVKSVKDKNDKKVNPYAVCSASIGNKKKKDKK